VEILVQRLAESCRREQDFTDRVCELVDSNDVLEQMKDKLEQKIQQFEELLATDNAGRLTHVYVLLQFERFLLCIAPNSEAQMFETLLHKSPPTPKLRYVLCNVSYPVIIPGHKPPT